MPVAPSRGDKHPTRIVTFGPATALQSAGPPRPSRDGIGTSSSQTQLVASVRPDHHLLVPAERAASLSRATWLLLGPLCTLVALLPVMRVAARLDTKTAIGSDGHYARHHAGLFIVYGLVVALPSALCALPAHRYRRYAIGVALLAFAVGLVCEAFVSITTLP